MYLREFMESLSPELALYGSINECTMTKTVLPPISEVSAEAVSFTKIINIKIYLSSIAPSTRQYFPVFPSCQSDAENQLFQYRSPRNVNPGFVIENVCIVT